MVEKWLFAVLGPNVTTVLLLFGGMWAVIAGLIRASRPRQ